MYFQFQNFHLFHFYNFDLFIDILYLVQTSFAFVTIFPVSSVKIFMMAILRLFFVKSIVQLLSQAICVASIFPLYLGHIFLFACFIIWAGVG